MQEHSGVVERAGEKKWRDKTFFNFKLVDEDTLYLTGEKDLGVKEGDKVEFKYELFNERPNVKSLEVVGSGPVNKAKKSAGKAANDYKKKDDYWTQKAEDDKTRQVIISYQAANKTAVDIVKMALEQEAISLGTAKAKKFDALMQVVDEVTDTIFEKYQNAGVPKEVGEESPPNSGSLDD